MSKITAPSVSIIIPALNEATILPATLRSLAAAEAAWEIIVVDGGSRDATRAIAAQAGACVLDSPRAQRAAQMNLGAAESRGDSLLFLHADTQLAPGAADSLHAALRDSRVAGGAFARRYTSPSRFLRLTCWLAEMRGRLCGWHLGDQAMFVRREIFERLGGFAELKRFEDLDFSRRLRPAGRIVTLRPPVLSCARRFAARGPAATTWSDFRQTCAYLRATGAS